MADVLWFNGTWTTTDQPVLGVEDRGLQFGDAIYEVIRFGNGRPSFNLRHFRRMQRSLAEIGIPSPWNHEDEYLRHVDELLERTSFDSGIIYIQVTRGESERNHVHSGDMRPNTIMYSRRCTFPDAEKKERGAVIVTQPDIRWGRCDLKTTNLLPAVLAKQAAKAEGAQEALLVRDGHFTECAASSFFGVRDGRVFTHPLGERILPGVVREVTIELARSAGIDVEERPLRDDELASLDEAFLTSTTLSVLAVTTVDGRRIADGRRGPITGKLQSMFDEEQERAFAGDRAAAAS